VKGQKGQSRKKVRRRGSQYGTKIAKLSLAKVQSRDRGKERSPGGRGKAGCGKGNRKNLAAIYIKEPRPSIQPTPEKKRKASKQIPSVAIYRKKKQRMGGKRSG